MSEPALLQILVMFLQRQVARVLLCAIAIALSACNQASDREVEKSLFRVLALKEAPFGSVVRAGTAFKISGAATAVTNNHVVQDATTIVLVYWSEGKFVESEARVEYADKAADLAVLKAVRPLPGVPLPVARYTPASGSEAWALGFPAAADAVFGKVQSIEDFLEKLSADASMSQPTRTFGTVSGERPRDRTTFIQHQVPISPGNSGGPLIDGCGAVIGINTLAGPRASAIFGAVSSRELIDLLQVRAIDANIVASRCWVVFEPRYMGYSASLIAALLVLAAGLVVFVHFSRRDSRWVGRSKLHGTRRGASASPAKVIDITPIPLPLEGRPEQPHRPRKQGYSAGVEAARSARLIPTSGGRALEIPLEDMPGSVVIGREPDCDVLLDDPSISRRHCRLDFEVTGEVRVHDLGSGNGTRINGKQLSKGTVRAGDKIGLGALEFRLELYSKPADARGTASLRSNAAAWLLAATDEQGNVTRFLVDVASNGTWIIGRARGEADLVIPSPTVSAKHAVLRSSSDGRLEIHDLGSSNGTIVNGRKIGREWTAIKPSGELWLGGCEIKLSRANSHSSK
jgi:pSer/pThr/pTyr-binding forkhead associated (FHA) protein